MLRREFVKLAPASIATPFLLGEATNLAEGATASTHPRTVDVRTFGATGDGKTLDSPSINKAIEAAAASGGGTVYIPAGTYLCYTLHLKSYIHLHLDAGSIIVAADTPESATGTGYDPAGAAQPWEAYQDFGHNHWANSLFFGDDLEHVSITGTGLIWGRGLSRGIPGELPRAEAPGVGNKALALKNCRNVTLRDFSMLSGGHFAILLTGVDNAVIDGLTIDTNRDGIDIDCCRNIRVSNCIINSPWDDGLVLKTSYALGSLRATENVLITNCHVTGAYSIGGLVDGTLRPVTYPAWRKPIGRMKCGTESVGDFRNITISNSVFDTCRGFALLTVDGGTIEDVTVSNLTMRNMNHPPLTLRLGQRLSGPDKSTHGGLRRIRISHIISSDADSNYACIIAGVPGLPIQDVSISDVYFETKGAGTQAWANRTLPEKVNGYPDADMFGPSPASGFVLRHVQNLQLNNVEIVVRASDVRPAIWAQDVNDLDISRLRVPKSAPALRLDQVSDLAISGCKTIPDQRVMRPNNSTI